MLTRCSTVFFSRFFLFSKRFCLGFYKEKRKTLNRVFGLWERKALC